MTYEQDTSPLDSSKWIDQGDLFYRPNDKVEFLEGLNAVYQMGQGIAVVASNEVMLNHYCRLIVSRLRKAKGFQSVSQILWQWPGTRRHGRPGR